MRCGEREEHEKLTGVSFQLVENARGEVEVRFHLPMFECSYVHMNTETLQRELALLRSYVVSIAGKDREGAYKPELVARVRKTLREEPTKCFKDANSFLREIERAV